MIVILIKLEVLVKNLEMNLDFFILYVIVMMIDMIKNNIVIFGKY